MWLLVTKQSDFSRVVTCPAFRLQDERCDDDADPEQYVIAFERETKKSRQQKKREQSRQPLMIGYDPNAACEPSPPERDSGRRSRRSGSPNAGVMPDERDSGRRSRRSGSPDAMPDSRDRGRRSRRSASPVPEPMPERDSGRRSRRSSSRDRSRDIPFAEAMPAIERDSGRRSRRSGSRDSQRDRNRGYASAPPSFVGAPRSPRYASSNADRGDSGGSSDGSGCDDGGSGSSSGGDSTTSRNQLLRGGAGRTRHSKASAEPPTSPTFVPLSSSALQQLPGSCERHSRPPSRGGGPAPSVVSIWDDEGDPDGTGRSAKVRATAMAEAMSDLE